MRYLIQPALAVLVLALVAGPVAAQVKRIQIKRIQAKKIKVQRIQKKFKVQPIVIGGRAGGDLNLVKDKGVQKDLKFSKEQAEKVAKLVKKQQDAVKGLKGIKAFRKLRQMAKENKKAIDDILQRKQAKRLAQLKIQARGPVAIYAGKTAKDLGISKDQRKAIIQIVRDAQPQRRQIVQQTKGNLQERRKKLAELNKELVQEIVKSLKPQQQKRWKEIAGAPYKGVLPQAGFGRVIAVRPAPGNIRPLPIQPKRIRIRPKQKKQGR